MNKLFIGWRTPDDVIHVECVEVKEKESAHNFRYVLVEPFYLYRLPVNYVRGDELNYVLYPEWSIVAGRTSRSARTLVKKDINAKKKKLHQGFANQLVKLARMKVTEGAI